MGLSEEAQTKDVALFGLPMKWIALVTLAIQNSTLNLVITYSRSETSERPYLNSTAVFLNELLKWASLVLLVTGVVLTQVQKFSINRNDPEDNQIKSASTLTIGLFAIFMACMSSGLSGVYFEKILKGSTTSLWVRNLQLSLFSLAISAGGIIMFDMGAVKENGFFYGYTLSTWGAIVSQAAGGIIVALVVKYADNILKGFATSISIIISSIVSIWMFDFYPGAYFLVGAVLVIYASITYGSDPNKASHIDKLLIPFTEKSGREDLD
ncbi:hypothetical protein H4219_000434 [Mycoemilia scoparia]|uniref:UDP-N-acetylglucosamine transporter n=1 Tax=Mycoemilia scoparia TaxID=417184 RepID=A0A9W8DRH9_9FUNG|nr:hypothetical protein H4219_000434 [Mycoemilia scoparia]